MREGALATERGSGAPKFRRNSVTLRDVASCAFACTRRWFLKGKLGVDMKKARAATTVIGAFGIAAVASGCVQHAGGEGGEGSSRQTVTIHPGSLIYQPPSVRVGGGGEGGEGGEGR